MSQSYCLILTLILAFVSACSSKHEEEPSPGIPESIGGLPADKYLKSVFLRYQSAQSYHDEGKVRLSYTRDGSRIVEEAPFKVWLDRNLLYVEAYDVRLRCDQSEAVAWIADPTTENHDSQVLAFKIDQGRPNLSQLFADQVLDEKLAAGLAGPPPQLEWLFAHQPMKHMFDNDCLISFQEARILEQRPCNVVDVTQENDRYRFWIDSRSSLIRRVDLPEILLSPESYARVKDKSAEARFSLTVDLQNATFGSPQMQPSATPLPSSPKYVGRFVALPPPEPPRLLGSIPSFAVRDQSSQIRFVDGRTDRGVTVVSRFVTNEVNDQLYVLNQWIRLTPVELQSRVRNLIVTNPDVFNHLPQNLQIPVVVDQSGDLTRALELEKHQVLVFDSAGRISWVQANMGIQSAAQLAAIVSDILDGVDVPGRLRDQRRGLAERYRGLLASEMARYLSNEDSIAHP